MATQVNPTALVGRHLDWANNTPELEAEHLALNGPIIRTRFPPEPNGFLHIGHAKSMNMNFKLAFDKLEVPQEHRRTVFRYDDTNPEAESQVYIDSIRHDLEWMGWKPEKTTFSSDNFQALYEYAIDLVQRGLAYVCHMSKGDMEKQRDVAKAAVVARANGQPVVEDLALIPGPYRNRSVEENLKLFNDMKTGRIAEGVCTLRLKMDFTSPNPNLYDLVAYRVKFVPHPHAGSGWCIYPSYDYTHGSCDSIEHVDYSICTLEFETRRENYFWLLQQKGIFRPKVFEMSRLNIEYTVLSKRRLLKLVTSGFVRGWDDPRMPTISGLRRRGYPAAGINAFCDDVGVSRANNLIEFRRLSQHIRVSLSDTATRAMAVLTPVECKITNFAEFFDSATSFPAPNFPQDADNSRGNHTITISETIFVDKTDYKTNEEGGNDPDFFGLAKGKTIGLKYANCKLVCDDVVENVLVCRAVALSEGAKPKSFLTWVPSKHIKCEVRKYSHLFDVPEPTDAWEDELNLESEVIFPNAMVDESVSAGGKCNAKSKWESNESFQFERLGYFIVDDDSDSATGKLVFNMTVGLKEDSGKKKEKAVDAGAQKKKDEQKEAQRLREERNKISEVDFFKLAAEFKGLYIEFDETGFPIKDKAGEAITKSAGKKLKKELDKHKKARKNII